MVSHHLILSLLTTMLLVVVPKVQAVTQEDIDLIKSALDALKEQNDALKTQNGGNLAQTSINTGKVDAVMNKVDEAADNLSTMSSRLSTTSTDVNVIKGKLSTTSTDVGTMKIMLSEVNSRASSLEAEVEILKRLSADLKTEHAAKMDDLKAAWRAQLSSPDKAWEESDKKPRATWPALITKTVKVFSSRSIDYRTILRTVLSSRMAALSGWATPERTEGNSLSETLTNIVQTSLRLTPEQFAKAPSRASYDAYRALINNVESITSQKLLQQEVDQNEAALHVSSKKTDTIRSWTQITVVAVITVLIILVIGFTGWFGYVCKKTQDEDEAATRRAEIRMRREAEGRIAGHVAHELLPLAPPPTAPPIIQAPRLYPQ